MKKAHIFYRTFTPTALSILQKKFDVTLMKGERPNEDELAELIDKNDAVIISVQEKLTPSLHEKIKGKKRIIATVSVGFDHISKLFFEDPDLTMISCNNANALSVAEHTLALLLALVKKLPQGHKAMLQRTGRAGIGGFAEDLTGQTLGLIGSGRIARQLINLVSGFNLKILCHSNEEPQDLKNKGVSFVPLETLLREADIVSLHVPLNDGTRNMLNETNMPLMKKTAFLLNTSRSALMDHAFTAKMVGEGLLAGAGLDIDADEHDHINMYAPFDNVILTPHVAGLTVESTARMDTEIAESVAKLG